MDTPATPRKRRSSKEVREVILALARELFDENGYQATTTVQIAKEAGVSERLIFSNFGTKAELFNAAVIMPFGSVITSYIKASARDTRDSSMEERIGYFVDGLYDLAREHRTALLTALQASTTSIPSPHVNVLDYLARSFQGTLRELGSDEEFRKEFREVYDGEASLAAFVGMIFGVALLDDLIFPGGMSRPSRLRLVDEMRKTILIGVARGLPAKLE